MPRTVQDILYHADELANRFENYDPNEQDERDPEAFTALRDGVLSAPTRNVQSGPPSRTLERTATPGH